MSSTRAWACSRASLDAGDPVAGTATRTGGYLVLEHGGPWGRKILTDAVFAAADGTPVPLGAHLAAVLPDLDLTPLLARRRSARHGVPSPLTVMLVAVGPDGGLGARTAVADVRGVQDLDLPVLTAQLRSGVVPAGWEPLGPQVLVCTHARRDACCGELGRPLVAALCERDPDRTWEVSHVGGHRLAANALVLPDGLLYGRLEPSRAGDLLAAHTSGRLLPDALRGRTALRPPEQAAEIALRLHLGADAAAGPTLAGATEPVSTTDGELTRTRWRWAGRTWEVDVVTVTDGPERPASCGAEPGPPPPRQEVRAIRAEPGDA